MKTLLLVIAGTERDKKLNKTKKRTLPSTRLPAAAG